MRTYIQISLVSFCLFFFHLFDLNAANKAVGSITVSQVDTFALKGMPDQPVLMVNIFVTGSQGTLVLQKLSLKTINQTNTNVDSVGVYSTPYERFSLADYPGEASLLDRKKIIVGDSVVLKNLTYSLQTGNNYFWVVMDLNKYSIASHTLDAFVPANGIVISGVSYPATDNSPATAVTIHSIYFTENFERKNLSGEPVDWDQLQSLTSTRRWKNNYGGHTISTAGHPPAPQSGAYNVMLEKTSYTSDTVILMSKPIDLSLSSRPVLTFYNAQVARCKDTYCTVADNDQLVVVYKIGENGSWNTLSSYTLATPAWMKRTIILPPEASSNNFFLGFKGITKYGWGVCVDSVVIYESNVVNREIKSIVASKASSDIVPQGSDINPVMRLNIRIKGNTGNILLNSIKVTSLNTSDADIKSSGVKLYATSDSLFLSPVLCGSGQTLSGGTATIAALNRTLETGENYFWVAYDVMPNAKPGNFLAADIKAGDINITGDVTLNGPFPAADLSPAVNRIIKQTIFSDDFEGTPVWSLTGLFQIGQPMGLGGLHVGMPDPSVAYSGSKVLGTALSPTGDYENSLTSATAYKATSPLIDGTYFKNIRFDYQRWLNIDNTDSAFIEYKFENDTNWKKLWSSGKKYIESKWQKEIFASMKEFQRKKFNLRFRLGPTDAIDQYSGFNIDYLFITGDSIPMDASVTKLLYPLTSCDLSGNEHVKVYVKNTGPRPLVNTPIRLSINGGKSYISETIPGPIAPNDSVLYTFSTVSDFSKFLVYQIIVKAAHPLDNFNDNDSIVQEVASLPTYSLPYRNTFEKDTTFWTPKGLNSSWNHGWPSGSYIGDPGEGESCWKTDFSGYHNLYEHSYLESPCFSFIGKTIPMLDFLYSTDINNQIDGAIMQYSTDDGITWKYLPKDNYNFSWNWYNDTVITLKHKGWTGRTLNGIYQEWKKARQILPSALAGQPKVRFRFEFKSDSTTNSRSEGFAFDDFRVLDAPYDIGVVSVNNLTSPACQFVNSPFLDVTIKNFGYQQMKTGDTIVIGAKVNGITQVVDTFRLSANLVKDATVHYTLKKRVNFDAAGNYTIKVFSIIEKEKDFYGLDNDTATFSLTIRPNPVSGLRKTYGSAQLDTLKLNANYDSNYSYKWTFNGVDSLIRIKSAKDTGKYYLEIVNSSTLCQTKDTIHVLALKLDIGVSRIVSPVTGCGYSTTYKPVIQIKNFGTDTLVKNKTIPLKIRLDNGSLIDDNIILSKALAPDSVYETSLNWSHDFLTSGSHALMIRTAMAPYDSDAANDSSRNNFTVYGYPAVELGPDVYVKALSYTIKLNSGYSLYQWSDGSDKDSLRITTSGKYKVSVTNSDGCISKDSVTVKLSIRDLKIKRIISPQNSCSTPGLSDISIKILNNGTDTIQISEPIPMQYSLNGGAIYPQTLNLTNPMLPGDSLTFTFTQKQDLSQPNTYKFKIRCSAANDILQANDSIAHIVKVFANPKIDLGRDDDKFLYQYRIYPGSGYKQYHWQDGSSDTAYLITQTHFEPLGTYSVTVTDFNGCTDSDTVTIHLISEDLGLKRIKFPETTCRKSDAESIYITVQNTGNQNLTSKDFNISYQVNDSTRIGEMFKFSGKPGDSTVYKLSDPVKLWKLGRNKISAAISMNGDVRFDNDTLSHFTEVLYGAIIDFGAINDTLYVDLPHTLDAGAGMGYTYNWSTGETTQSILVTNENTYNVTVTTNQCANTKEVIVIDKYYDLAVSGFIPPASLCLDGKKKTLGVEISNKGKMVIDGQPLQIKYNINGKNEKTQNVTFTGKPGQSVVYNFSDSADVALPGKNKFTLGLTYAQDENSVNNEKTDSLDFLSKPVINFNAINDTVKVTTLPYILDAGSGNGYIYKWQDNSSAQTFQVENSGTYQVIVSNEGCSSQKSVVVWHLTPSRIISDKADVLIYPNPARENFKLELSVRNTEEIVLEFVSSNGSYVSSVRLRGSTKYLRTFDVTNLPRGLYYIRVYQKGWLVLEKVLVQ